MRFDEVELDAVPLGGVMALPEPEMIEASCMREAARLRRTAALLTDLSLFAALVVGLSPLLLPAADWISIAALAGFVVLLSFYYFVGSWLLWGKTIGGAIFGVRVVSVSGAAMALEAAVLRWGGLYVSLAIAGLGFLTALLPSRRSLPDRLSATVCVSGA